MFPEWAPKSAKRFRELTQVHFFDDTYLFNVQPGLGLQVRDPPRTESTRDAC